MMVLPGSFGFAFLVIVMVLLASILYSSNVTSNSNAQMLATSQQVLTNYETYFDSVLTTSSNIAAHYDSSPVANRSTSMQSYFDTLMSLKSEVIDMLTACGSTTAKTADVFIYQFSDTYIGTVRTALETDLKASGITPTFYDGGGVSATQVQQIESAIAKKSKLLIPNLVEQTATGDSIAAKAKAAGIPAIFFNREVPDSAVTSSTYPDNCFVGTDPDQAGYMQGDIIASGLIGSDGKLSSTWDQNGDGKITYVMVIVTAIQVPAWFNFDSFIAIVKHTSSLLPLALGVAGTIVLTGTDLSLGRIWGFTALLSASLLGYASTKGVIFPWTASMPWIWILVVLLASMLVGGICGALNGFFVAEFSIHPFVVTLATQLIIYGAVLLYGNQLNLSVAFQGTSSTAAAYTNFVSSGFYIGTTLVEWYNVYAIIMLIVMSFIWYKTKFGKAMAIKPARDIIMSIKWKTVSYYSIKKQV